MAETNIPTLEDFKNAVKPIFWSGCTYLTEEQVDEYLNSDEAMQVIKEAYDRDIDKVRSGETPVKIFLRGRAAVPGNCLALMYE